MNIPTSSHSNEEKLFPTYCGPNCLGGCRIYAHVRNGKIVKTSPAPLPDERYNRICLRGLALPQYVYNPNRLKYPMKRVGERGAGKWERISWDEAIAVIVEKFNGIREAFGPQAVCYSGVSGSLGTLNNGGTGIYNRLFHAIGGTIINPSLDAAIPYGSARVAGNMLMNDISDYVNARNIIVMGANITEAHIHDWHFMADAQEGGTRIIVIDPRYSITASKADSWIPIRPGSDAALLMAMLHVIFREGLEDKKFIHDHTVGPFLVREDTGEFLRQSQVDGTVLDEGSNDPVMVWDEDAGGAVPLGPGVRAAISGSYRIGDIVVNTSLELLKAAVAPYSPAYASGLTDIPADTIERLAVTYAGEKPSSFYIYMGANHYHNAHMTGHAVATLAGITGNVGKPGACLHPAIYMAEHIDFKRYLYPDGRMGKTISVGDVRETTQRGTLKGAPFPIKAMYICMGNPAGNHADQRLWLDEVFSNLDFIVTCELQMSESAQYSDIILPAVTWFETTDIHQAQAHPYVLYGQQVIDPLYEGKSNFEIAKLLAQGLGAGQYFDCTLEEMLDIAVSDKFKKRTGTTLEMMKEQGAVTLHAKETFMLAGKDGIFRTPSRRLEFYCEHPVPRMPWSGDVDFDPAHEHLPRFNAPLESWPDLPRSRKYPFTLIQEHSRWRVNKQWTDTPWLRELDPEPFIQINPQAANDREINNGDYLEVFNDRGVCIAKAVLSEAVPYHLLSTQKGWISRQFKKGSDQELTHQKLHPASVNQSFFDISVDVKKWEGDMGHGK